MKKYIAEEVVVHPGVKKLGIVVTMVKSATTPVVIVDLKTDKECYFVTDGYKIVLEKMLRLSLEDRKYMLSKIIESLEADGVKLDLKDLDAKPKP